MHHIVLQSHESIFILIVRNPPPRKLLSTAAITDHEVSILVNQLICELDSKSGEMCQEVTEWFAFCGHYGKFFLEWCDNSDCSKSGTTTSVVQAFCPRCFSLPRDLSHVSQGNGLEGYRSSNGHQFPHFSCRFSHRR